jgi:hypothetical protein
VKQFYLIATIIGAVVPYYFLGTFFLEHGLDVPLFFQQTWATPSSRMWVADLLISSVVFWGFLFTEGPRRGIGRLWVYVLLNLLVGLSMALPLFLYMRERRLEPASAAA